MTCAPCDRAAAEPAAYDYQGGCDDCLARALAATGAHLASQERQSITPEYREALEILFGQDWKAGNEKVKHWAQQIESRNRRKAMAP